MRRCKYRRRMNSKTMTGLDTLKRIAIEAIVNAEEGLHYSITRTQSLAWFNERSTKVWGYGWCLQFWGNPNAIRRRINRVIKREPRATTPSWWH